LHGGRPEFYPEDRQAIYTLLDYRNRRQERDRKKADAESRMKNRMKGGL
jgi:hypothetical protein